MSVLSWNVQNAVTVRITPGIGVVANQGTQLVYPTTTTVYTLTATDRRGRQKTATTTVMPTVIPVGTPPVGTPPVGTPPVGFPVGNPVGNPVGTPPVGFPVGNPVGFPVGNPVGNPVG